MTEKDKKIYDFLSTQTDWIGPTKIGLSHGIIYTQASSWCMSNLKRLMAEGLIISKNGRYKIKK